MSDGDTLRGNLLNWPTLLLFVLLSWGIVLLPPTLRSTRPTGEPERSPGRVVGYRFESRLWQDPFDVLFTAQKLREQSPLPDQGQALFCDKRYEGRVLVLLVFLPGENYPEDVENRLRSRYAVVSALGMSGYIPDEGGDLRCFQMPLGSKKPLPLFPFEWFSYYGPGADAEKGLYPEHLDPLTRLGSDEGTPPPQRATVIWVDERLLDEKSVGLDPVTVLKQLATGLKKTKEVRLAVLGPQSSSTLKDLLSVQNPTQETSCAAGGGASTPSTAPKDAGVGTATPSANSERIKIYSFASTVEALQQESPKPPKPWPFKESFEVEHVIGTDVELANALRKELDLRGITAMKELPTKKEEPKEQPTIALVAEWDTYYGRSMFYAFSESFQLRGIGNCLACFTYLQGIDGRLPQDRPLDSGNEEKASDKAKSVLPGGGASVAAPEVRAFGRSQVDRLQRLVDQMRRTGGDGWKAIGVVGSDFYDKILLLDTLKHEFPDALFFTTDLDARYLDTAEHRTTRNLLVASHFGLELHERLQRGIPPFRSVYQTALFFGCLKALHAEGVPPPGPPEDKNAPANALCLEWKNDQNNKLKPTVFEIGRTRAYPLTAPSPEELHPTSYKRSFGLGTFRETGLVMVLTSGVLLWAMLWPLTGFRLAFAVGTAGAVILLLAIAAYDHLDPDGEPVSLLEGISNWPTVLLRLAAVAFSAFAMLRAWEADNKNAAELAERFELETAGTEGGGVLEAVRPAPNPPPPPAPAPASNPVPLVQTFRWAFQWASPRVQRAVRSLAQMFRRAFHWARVNSIGTLSAPGEKADPKEVWKEYRRLGRADHRAARVVGYVLLYLVFCGGLIGLFGPPNNPYRGWLNHAVNVAVLYTAIPVSVVLFWYVIDATRLCGRLIWLLMDKETLWPEPALQRMAAELGGDLRLLHSDDHTVREAVKKSLEQHADVTFLGERTAVVGRLAYDAAFVYLLMFLARSPFFDQYVMSWSMILIYTVALSGVFACGVWLRLSARRARRIAVDKVHDLLRDLRLASPADCRAAARALERIAGAIGKVHTGAFSTLAEDPILRTLVLIVGGIGALLSLEPIGLLLR